MKSMRKLLALTLVLVMLTGLAITASAATITINQDTSVDGTIGAETYTLYKIFDVTKTESVTEPVTTAGGPGTATGFSYSIAASSPWVAKLGSFSGDTWTSATGQSWVKLVKSPVDTTKYSVEWVGANTAEAADAFANYLLANKGTIAADKTATSSNGVATVTDAADGYWLIDSSLGTNLILATSNIVITTKNSYTDDDKVAETASATIGQNVTYYVKVFFPASIDTTLPVVVHDELADVFTFNNDVKVSTASATNPGNTAADYKALTYSDLTSAYTVKTTGLTDSCDFEISINTTGLEGKYIVFKYTALMTSAADPDGDGYVNKEYSTYSHYTTKPNEPKVKTYDISFTKVDGDGKKLDGAEFQLYAAWDTTTNKPSGNPFNLIKVTGTGTAYSGYKLADADDTGTTTTIVVNSKTDNAATKIAGLGGADNTNGTNYYLLETKAPDGFNLLTSPIIINVKDDGTITITLDGQTLSSANDAFDVVNYAGTVLPSTGGIGTTLFYVIGTVMVLAAGVVLVTKRRVRD